MENKWYNTHAWEKLCNFLYEQYPQLYKRMVQIVFEDKISKVIFIQINNVRQWCICEKE